jgi:hypothetical protein
MQAVTTIGLDIAKSVFQIPGIDAAGTLLLRRSRAGRSPVHPTAPSMLGPTASVFACFGLVLKSRRPVR